MKKILLLSSFLLTLTTGFVYSQVTLPRVASPAATVSQTIGVSTIEVSYSRPSVNGRDIWGSLVPYGWNIQGFGAGNEAPWRSGANENTTLTLSHDAMVQGIKVPAGSYGLFFVINEDNSGEVVLSKNTSSWGSYWYDSKEDEMRANINILENEFTERLTYDFVNIDKNSTDLVLNWEKKQFPVSITFDVDNIVLANASDELRGSTGFNAAGPASAANYALANKVQLDRGLQWAEIAITQNPTFSNYRIKSAILEAQGKSEEAEVAMNQAMANANEPQINVYGYQLLNQQKFDKAIEVLKKNTVTSPKSANAWDSLGEAYALKGDEKNAIKCFKKALKLNPPANVKANSEKYLKQFGAL